jgi:cell division protease FtsH
MAYSMVTVYGMNKEIGNMSFFDSKAADYAFQKPYSEATAEKIDREAKGIIDAAFERTKELLVQHREKLDIVARELLEKEIIFQSDLERLIGKRPFEHPTTYQRFTNGKDEEKATEKEADPAPSTGDTPAAEGEVNPEPSSVSPGGGRDV